MVLLHHVVWSACVAVCEPGDVGGGLKCIYIDLTLGARVESWGVYQAAWTLSGPVGHSPTLREAHGYDAQRGLHFHPSMQILVFLFLSNH